jgi:hypothetical protein
MKERLLKDLVEEVQELMEYPHYMWPEKDQIYEALGKILNKYLK